MKKLNASAYHRNTGTNLRLKTLFILGLVCFLSVAEADAQSRKRLRELEKMEKEHEAEAEDGSAEALERHMSIQSKQTKKEMKKYKKMSKRHNNNRREFFLKRWFRK